MELFSLKDKTILITGASRGIGKTLAQEIKNSGAIVYGTGRSQESISWMKDGGVEGRIVDIRQPGSVLAVIEEIVKKHGKLDCLINNAGVATNTPASYFKEDEIAEILDTNFTGVFRACQAYYKTCKRQGGNIVNLASVLGMVGSPLASIYSGAKAGVINLSRALAIEWVGNNFRVNTLCPGFIETDMTTMITSKPHVMEQMAALIPMKRIGKPEDLVGAAIFLASDASRYMTGQTVVVDGGFTSH